VTCLPRPVAGGAVRPPTAKIAQTLRHNVVCAARRFFAVENGALPCCGSPWGIEPDVVLGHSVGQLRSGMCGRSLQPRGRRTADWPSAAGCSAACQKGGRMVAVFADAKHVRGGAPASPRECRSGAYNGPNTVLSGPGEDLENRSSPDSVTRGSAAPGWKPATPSTRNCWIRCSVNSSRTQRSWSSMSRRCRWCATAPGAVLTAQNPDRRSILAAAIPRQPVQFRRKACAPFAGAGMLGTDGDRPANRC